MQNRSSPNRSPAKSRPSTSPTKTTVVKNGNTTTTTRTITQKFTTTMLDQREKDVLQLSLKEKEIELEHKLNTLIALNEKLQVFNDLQKDVAENQAMMRESEDAREQLQNKLIQTAQQVREDTELKEKYQSSLIAEIDQLKRTIQDMSRKASQKQQQHIQETKAQDDRHTNEMATLKRQIADQMAHMKSDHETEMERQRSAYETKIDELELSLRRCQQTIVKLESTVLEMNTRLTQKEDVERQLAIWKGHHDSMEDSKRVLQVQLEGASSYIHQLDEKYYESQTTQLEMLKQMKEYEADLESSHQEIEQLRQYIIDLKSRIAVYIPVKGDTIDKKLAEYINNYPDRQKLKIMFMRESEGVYQFGTKRVYVKCAKDKIEIKVGGGFLSLDEFLDQYTPVELEKLERKDPMRRMTDRIALQKTLGRVANVSPTASPTRAGPRKKTAV